MTRRLAVRLATAAGWLAVLIGLVHLAVTASAFDRPSLAALWFAGSGLAVVLIGALTLLSRGAPASVRRVAVGANTAGLGLAVGFSVLTGWGEPQGPILAVVFLAGGAAALWGSAALGPDGDTRGGR